MTKSKADKILKMLLNEYKGAKCSLDYSNVLELLIATRLSAQCTDERVNIVTKKLFSKYSNVDDYADADIEELEDIVCPCGFYKEKSKSIKMMSRQIIEKYGGEVPKTLDELITLSGVGRKTANLIVGEAFGGEAYICDTHCIRLSNRLGFSKSSDPLKTELALRKYIPPQHSLAFCHTLVSHGRAVCKARKPLCTQCFLKSECKFIPNLHLK